MNLNIGFKLVFLISYDIIKGNITNNNIEANNKITPNNLLGTDLKIA